MANIPTIKSTSIPTTKPGRAFSIGEERGRPLTIGSQEADIWGPAGAGQIVKVLNAESERLYHARDVYAVNKTKIEAENSYRQLISEMQSPEFRGNNNWKDYGSIYAERSKEIRSSVMEKFGGSAQAKKGINLVLSDMHSTNDVKVNSLMRHGETNEIQRSIPGNLEYYGRSAVDASKNGDNKAVINAMSSAEAYLAGMRKSGIITGTQQNAYLENFQGTTNDVIHKERIYDAAALPNRKESAARLNQLVKDYSEQREDLDEDQRVTYKHMAQQALSQKLRESSQSDQFAKYELEEARKNSLALAKERGTSGLISRNRFIGVYGNKNNKAKAEYTQYLDDYKYSLRHHGVMGNVDAVPPVLYQAALEDFKSKAQTHDDIAILRDAEQRANQNIRMLLDDPGKFAQERANIPKDLEGHAVHDALILEQLKRGVGEKETALLTNDQAKRSVGILRSQTADEAITSIVNMRGQYGRHFSTIMRDMQRQKLPVAYELVARMDPSPRGDRGLMEEILNANSLNDQEWSKTMGIEANIMRQKVNDQINVLFKPYEDALMNTAVTPDDIKKVGDLKKLMGNLALYRMETQGLGLSDTSDATSSAVRDVTNQYYVVPNKRSRFNVGSFGFGGQDPYFQRFLIPKVWADQIGKDKNVGDVLETARGKLIDEELDGTIYAMQQKNIARGFESFSDEDVDAAKEAFILEAYWATDNETDGLLLMSDNGLRLRVTYDKIVEWARTEGTPSVKSDIALSPAERKRIEEIRESEGLIGIAAGEQIDLLDLPPKD